MNGRRASMGAWGLAMMLCTSPSFAFDPLFAEKSVPASPSVSLLPGEQPCAIGPTDNPLTLREAVERALCSNPKTREAWANVKAQAAAVGIARAAFLPTVSGKLAGRTRRLDHRRHQSPGPQLGDARNGAL